MKIRTNTEENIQAAAQFDYRGYTISATTLNGLHEIGVIGPDEVLRSQSFAPNGDGMKAALEYIDSDIKAASARIKRKINAGARLG